MTDYPNPPGGVPPQSQLLSRRAVFTEAYVVIPKVVMTDIVTTRWPFWEGARAWVLARPMSGFSETFSQALVELEPGGSSNKPEPDPKAEGVIFITRNGLTLSIDGTEHLMQEGGYAYLPPGCEWELWNKSPRTTNFVWIRKEYQFVDGLAPPKAFVTNENDVEMSPMPQSHGLWGTKRFVDSDDMSHDMHVNIVQFEPGGVIAFAETHVMEHGLYVIEGKGVYRLNTDWVEVEAGDFMWLRAFCPQACYAGGPGRFRYLLYKDVNRHMPLRVGGVHGA